MKERTRRSLSVLVVLLLLLAVAATVSAHGRAPSGNFRAHLSGDKEVPAVDTDAQGQAIVQFDHDVSALAFRLIVANIDDVVAAHIHCAPAGENGPVGLTLFTGGPTSDSGTLAEGTATAPDAGNACGWEDLDAVNEAIEAGEAYVNVHTLANLPGEIRGQLH